VVNRKRPSRRAGFSPSGSGARLPHEKLTPRELDILKEIARGKSNKAIAFDLDLTEGTVKGYVSVVLSKLDVTDRTQAALYAVKHQLTER
jgi:DNA-binding NarL/FixJ family response regulator